MWQVMQVAADAAREYFSSWEEYGRSFAFGRGVWHGDEEDCQTAWEIVSALLEEETSAVGGRSRGMHSIATTPRRWNGDSNFTSRWPPWRSVP